MVGTSLSRIYSVYNAIHLAECTMLSAALSILYLASNYLESYHRCGNYFLFMSADSKELSEHESIFSEAAQKNYLIFFII